MALARQTVSPAEAEPWAALTGKCQRLEIQSGPQSPLTLTSIPAHCPHLVVSRARCIVAEGYDQGCINHLPHGPREPVLSGARGGLI